MKTNALYYGDNLEILREHIDGESVDLVYLDPPFNSNRDYNVIFRDESGRQSDAQLLAFEDTWHWGPSTDSTFEYLTNTAIHNGGVNDATSSVVAALLKAIGKSEMSAYLIEMTVRLVELRRVLKPTGSIWLHCDPTAAHYLKMVLDSIFGPTNFRNEVIWKRTQAHNDPNRAGSVHDTLLYYARDAKQVIWNGGQHAVTAEYLKSHYSTIDAQGRPYQLVVAHAPGPGPSRVFWGKELAPPAGRHWSWTQEGIDERIVDGRLVQTKSGMPRLVQMAPTGVPLQDVWTDIDPVNSQAKERLGYPTQKPLKLLERIIEASSNPGDVLLDPFCGCGTALVAAQKLGRQSIGIDITYLSIAVMEQRLKKSFDLGAIEVIGQPTEVEGARRLAKQVPNGPYQFQWWALTLIDAQPVGGIEKKGADKGIDGVITFTNAKKELETVLVSVKSGHVNPGLVQSLLGTVQQNNAAIGIFITLEEPTKAMREVADQGGNYHSDWTGKDYPRLQVLSIADLLERGKRASLPPSLLPTYQQAQKVKTDDGSKQQTAFDQSAES